MTQETFARLLNGEGELIAEGPCWLDESARHATLEPTRTPDVIQKQHGDLTLKLDSGESLLVSDKAMILRLSPPAGTGDRRRNLYRLRLIENGNGAQDAEAAGAVGEGAPTSASASPPPMAGETPAAR